MRRRCQPLLNVAARKKGPQPWPAGDLREEKLIVRPACRLLFNVIWMFQNDCCHATEHLPRDVKRKNSCAVSQPKGAHVKRRDLEIRPLSSVTAQLRLQPSGNCTLQANDNKVPGTGRASLLVVLMKEEQKEGPGRRGIAFHTFQNSSEDTHQCDRVCHF